MALVARKVAAALGGAEGTGRIPHPPTPGQRNSRVQDDDDDDGVVLLF